MTEKLLTGTLSLKTTKSYVKPQIKQNNKIKMLTFFEMTTSFHEVSARNLAEKLRESSRSLSAGFREDFFREIPWRKKWTARTYAKLRESSRLRIFVRGVNAKRELFFLG